MNCMRIDPNYTTSKNGKHRKELKAVLRNIYDSLGRYPGYRTVMPRYTSVAKSAVSKWRVNFCGLSGTRTNNQLSTLANLTSVTLATLRPGQPVGKCYSVASLTVCEFGFQD